jgi:hypothetical protein
LWQASTGWAWNYICRNVWQNLEFLQQQMPQELGAWQKSRKSRLDKEKKEVIFYSLFSRR